MDQRPIYGADLRRAVKVNLLLDDLHESKRHKYVNRASKHNKPAVKDCYKLPNAVFNPYCQMKELCCLEYDFNGPSSNPLIEAIDLTLPDNADQPEQQTAYEVQIEADKGKKCENMMEIASYDQAVKPFEPLIGFKNCSELRNLIKTPLQRQNDLEEVIKHFKCIIPKAVAQTPQFIPTAVDTRFTKDEAYKRFAY
jgi:hypothetical protein